MKALKEWAGLVISIATVAAVIVQALIYRDFVSRAEFDAYAQGHSALHADTVQSKEIAAEQHKAMRDHQLVSYSGLKDSIEVLRRTQEQRFDALERTIERAISRR